MQFRELGFIPNKYETEFLEILEKYVTENKLTKYYIIASADKDTKKESEKALDHEIAHGLFYLNIDYKSKVLNLLKLHQYYDKFKAAIKKYKYHDDVIEDEVHAFLTTDPESELKDRFKNLSKSEIEFVILHLRKKLVTLYTECKNNY